MDLPHTDRVSVVFQTARLPKDYFGSLFFLQSLNDCKKIFQGIVKKYTNNMNYISFIQFVALTGGVYKLTHSQFAQKQYIQIKEEKK